MSGEKQMQDMNNKLALLSSASNNLKNAFTQQKLDMDAKHKESVERSNQSKANLHGKLQQTEQSAQEMANSLQEKQVQLKQLQELTQLRQKEISEIKLRQEQELLQLQSKSEAEYNLKLESIKTWQSKVESLKMQMQSEKSRKKEWQLKLELFEKEYSEYKMSMASFESQLISSTNIEFSVMDIEKERMSQERFKQRYAELQNLIQIQQSLYTQYSAKEKSLEMQLAQMKSGGGGGANYLERREALVLRLDKLKIDNKLLFDLNIQYVEFLNKLQVEFQFANTKKIEFTEVANLLKDQNQFEKLSRKVQMRIENIEDMIRFCQDSCKETQSALRALEIDTEMQNGELSSQLKMFYQMIETLQTMKTELYSEAQIVMNRVCNKPPSDIKIEQIDQNMKLLNEFDVKILEMEQSAQTYRNRAKDFIQMFMDYQYSIQSSYHSKSENLITINGQEMDKISGKIQNTQAKIGEIEAKFRDKQVKADTDEQELILEQLRNSLVVVRNQQKKINTDLDFERSRYVIFKDQYQQNGVRLQKQKSPVQEKGLSDRIECDIQEYVILYRELSDQNEQLKKIDLANLQDIDDKLDQTNKQLKQFLVDKDEQKVVKQKKDVEEGREIIKKIDDKIQQQKDRLDNLLKNCSKLDEKDKDRQNIQDQIDKARRDLAKLDQQRNNLEGQLSKMDIVGNGYSDPDELNERQKRIDDVVGGLENLLSFDVTEKESDVDRIEEDLRDAIRKLRKQNRDKCMDVLEQANKDMKEFAHTMDIIEKRIIETNKQIEKFQSMYNYPDKQRSQDQQVELLDKIDQETQKHKELMQIKNQLTQSLGDLTKDIDRVQKMVLNVPILQQGDDSEISKDEIAEKWLANAAQAKVIDDDIKDNQQKANQLLDRVELIQQVGEELQEKYKQKHKLYNDCKNKKRELDQVIREQDSLANKIENENLSRIQDYLSKIVMPQDQENHQDFINQYKDKQSQLQNQTEKIREQKLKIRNFEEKLNQITQRLPLLGDELINVQELQEMKDNLNKLQLELGYARDQLKNMYNDAEGLLEEVSVLIEKNKSLLEKDDDKIQDMIGLDLSEIEKYNRDTQDLLNNYKDLIKEGFKLEDDEIQNHLRGLNGDCKDLERDLVGLQKKKKDVVSSDMQTRQKFNDLKVNFKKINPIQFLQIHDQLLKNKEDAGIVKSEYEAVNRDLIQRIKSLTDYLSRYNKLLEMYQNLEEVIGQMISDHDDYNDIIDQIDLNIKLVYYVLQAMEKGIATDYLGKEQFIASKMSELKEIEKKNNIIRDRKAEIQQQVDAIKKEWRRKDMNQEEIYRLLQSIDQIKEAIQQERDGNQNCYQEVDRIRVSIGDAELVRIFGEREKELFEFSKMLKATEEEYAELRKFLEDGAASDYQEELWKQLRDIDLKLRVFREDRASYKRVLFGELQTPIVDKGYIKHDLRVLKDCVEKIVNLGLKLSQSADLLRKVQMMGQKLKRDIQGYDLLTKLEFLKREERDQKQRIESIQSRIQRISRGAQDQDGNTSSSEESTFIETLLEELPQIQAKEKMVHAECQQALDIIGQINKDIDRQSTSGNDEFLEQIVANIEHVETKFTTNEKTLIFLERLVSKLELNFVDMDVRKKINKRVLELSELENIGEDFQSQLEDLEIHIARDINKLEENKRVQGGQQIMSMFVDEQGRPVNLLEEIISVQDELRKIFDDVKDSQLTNKAIKERRVQVGTELQIEILGKILVKYRHDGEKVVDVDEVFLLLRQNGKIKKKIIELIKALKVIRSKMKEQKAKYQMIRMKIEKQNKPTKYYRALKGDLVDELFAEYINKLNCPVPITRLGNNQYTFGTKKIYAKVINGKLVIRVGGGYMGIEEFMMYYGDQELTRIQKQEGLNFDEPIIGLLDDNAQIDDRQDNQKSFKNLFAAVIEKERGEEDYEDGGSKRQGRHQDQYLGVGSNNNGGTYASPRKSSMDKVCSIDAIKQKIRDQSNQKQKVNSPFLEKGKSLMVEESKFTKNQMQRDDSKTQVIGLADVRKALKSNLVEIQAYQEHAQVGLTGFDAHSKKSAKLSKQELEQMKLEKQLRSMEKKIGDKLKQTTTTKQAAPKRNVFSPHGTTQTKFSSYKATGGSSFQTKNKNLEVNRKDQVRISTNSSNSNQSMGVKKHTFADGEEQNSERQYSGSKTDRSPESQRKISQKIISPRKY